MNCPKCKDQELKKKSHGSPLACQQCSGIWLEDHQVPQLAKVTENYDTSPSDGQNNDDRTGLCPSGHGMMLRAKVDMGEPFYLEKCPHCGGIWFDKGEWRRIADTELADNIDVIWSKSWQRQQRQAKDRNKFMQMNQRLLGDDVYEVIVSLSEKLKNHTDKGRAIAFLQQLTYEK